MFPDHPEAHRLLDGRLGIEIGGAAHNPFNIPGCLNVDVTGAVGSHDQALYELYVRSQIEHGAQVLPVDVFAEGDKLPFADSSLGYVLSSHMVEHLANPIRAFVEWQRVLEDGGIVFMIVPTRTALPEDVGRSVTELLEHVHAYEQGWTAKTRPHLSNQGPRGHYSVFTVPSLLELVKHCNTQGLTDWQVVLIEDFDAKVGNGHTLACRVRKPGAGAAR